MWAGVARLISNVLPERLSCYSAQKGVANRIGGIGLDVLRLKLRRSSPAMTISHSEQKDGRKLNSCSCPYCQGQARSFVSSGDRNRRTSTSIFHYHQCSVCGLVFMEPIPSDLAPFYLGGYEAIPTSLSELRDAATRERYRLDPILKYKKSGKLLEIGPWRGAFSCNAKDAGFDVTAIEANQDCVDFLNTNTGIRALQSSDPADVLSRIEEKFDVIALWHSLEHLRSPWLVLERAAKRLAPGGILLVAIPNIESYQFAVLRKAWKHLDAPRHLFFYPIESLVKLCEKFGLSPLEITTADELSDALSRDAWHSLAKSLIRVKYARGALALIFHSAARRREIKANAGAGLTALFQLAPTPRE